jgi:hypothetical protein
MDLCQIIFLFSDLIRKEALMLLHTNDCRLFEMEEAPNNKNTLASLTEDVILEILHPLLALLQMCLSLLEAPHLRQP